MVPILLLFGAAVAVAAITYWDKIREWVVDTAAQWVRSTWGRVQERWLQGAVVMLDRVITPVRNYLRRSVFARVANEPTPRHCYEEEIPLEDVPDEIRATLNRQPVTHSYVL